MVRSIQITLPKGQVQMQVLIGSGILQQALEDLLEKHTEENLFVVTNETIAGLYPDFANRYLPPRFKTHLLCLPDGEQFKNLESIQRIYEFLVGHKANRKSILIAFGGGVIGDMTGFAAATYMRGIEFVQVPTTLLSQVDSSIGGKTGVNLAQGKNNVGAFKQPLQTIIDVDFLDSLPQREFVAGYAELIKHGIIQDAYLFQILNRQDPMSLQQNKPLLIDAIFRSCEVKADVVRRDEKENNIRAMLNFGHTLGHLLETLTQYKVYLHGEAVIKGMLFAAWWSMHHHHLEQADYRLITKHLAGLKIMPGYPKMQKNDFITLVENDKKASSSGIRFVGLSSLGNARIFDHVTAESLWQDFQAFLQTEA